MAKANDVDITSNVRAIEKLKCQLLSNVSSLYENMQKPECKQDETAENISDIIITAYVLAGRLGITYQTIDTKIAGKLKIQGLTAENKLSRDYSLLHRHRGARD